MLLSARAGTGSVLTVEEEMAAGAGGLRLEVVLIDLSGSSGL
jgi:hypothetical protein